MVDLLSIKEHHAQTLLIHYQWDVEKLVAVFVEKGKESLFFGAGVTLFDNQYGNSSFAHSSQISCDVCIEDVPGDQMTRNCRLPCWILQEIAVSHVCCYSWLCGGATGSDHTYRSIAGHSCGRYLDDKEKQMERAKRDLDRYTHYHHRYKAHTDSSKLEDKLRDTILEKVSKSEKRELQLKDFSWVTNGLDRLFRSRRVLSYSYAFAYYMFGDELFKDEMSPEEREIKKNLFEDQQQQLEGNVEKLSQFLEEPFDEFSDDKVTAIRIQIINLSVAVDSLCKKMYECIENDLLGSLQRGIHNIAPYRSKGIEQAAEFYASWNSKGADKFQPLDSGTSGVTSRPEQASGSRSSEDTVCSSSQKRPKKEGTFINNKVTLLDLNLPADFIDQN